jgi:hypothetical protein
MVRQEDKRGGYTEPTRIAAVCCVSLVLSFHSLNGESPCQLESALISRRSRRSSTASARCVTSASGLALDGSTCARASNAARHFVATTRRIATRPGTRTPADIPSSRRRNPESAGCTATRMTPSANTEQASGIRGQGSGIRDRRSSTRHVGGDGEPLAVAARPYVRVAAGA